MSFVQKAGFFLFCWLNISMTKEKNMESVGKVQRKSESSNVIFLPSFIKESALFSSSAFTLYLPEVGSEYK